MPSSPKTATAHYLHVNRVMPSALASYTLELPAESQGPFLQFLFRSRGGLNAGDSYCIENDFICDFYSDCVRARVQCSCGAKERAKKRNKTKKTYVTR